jgi:hypothetical protein
MSILQWIGGHSRNFSDKLNWKPQISPNSTSDVQVKPSSPVAITVANATINSLVTSGNSTLNVTSTDTFTIRGTGDASNPTGSSTNAGTISLGSACDLFLDGKFTNAGTLNTAAGSDVWVNSTFVNTRTVHQNGDFTLSQSHGGTVTNAGGATWSINGAVDVGAGSVPGSHFTNAGTLTRGGTGVTDIAMATTNSGHVSVNSGQLEFLSTVSNTGTMTATSATLSLDQAVSGVGTLDLGKGGTLDILSGADSGQTVDFLSSTANLDLESAGTFKGHISGFGGSDLIDLAHTIATSESFSGGVLTLSNGSTPVAHLDFNGSYSTSSFHLTSDGSDGTLIHFV